MTTFTATAEPDNVPPRVRLDFDTEVVGSVFTEIKVTRDGTPIRAIVPVGSQISVGYDYDAPFGVLQQYTVQATVADPGALDWTESWVSIAAWTGATASWSGSAGVASSAIFNAAITRSASGTIGAVVVNTPTLIRIEALDASNAVVASVECGDGKITLYGAGGYSQVAGSGTFTLSLVGNLATANGTGWTVGRAFVGVPVKVRVIGMAGALLTTSWSTIGWPNGVALDSSGNVFVVDGSYTLVRKYTSTGTQTAAWSTVGSPSGVAVDSSGNVYVLDDASNLLRKFNSAGTQTASWSTVGYPSGVAVDSSGNVYILDATSNVLRKFNSAGTQTASWSTTGQPYAVAVDSSGNLFVTTSGNVLRKFNSAGTQTASWSTTGAPYGVAVDSSGNVYVTDATNIVVRKFNSAGTQTAVWSTTSFPVGIAVDNLGKVYVADSSVSRRLRRYQQASASVGQLVTRLLPSTLPFAASEQATVDADQAWLIHPLSPDLSISIDDGTGARFDGINIDISTAQDTTREQGAETFSLIGRARKVVVGSGSRPAPEWTLVLLARRTSDRDLVHAIVDDESPLLLRIPPAIDTDLADGWYAVAATSVSRVLQGLQKGWRRIALPLTPVDPPVLVQGAQWTWDDVLMAYETWDDVLASNDTWFDLLVGPQ